MRQAVQNILRKAEEILKTKDRCIIGIDGRCTSGKSTLGTMLQEASGGTLIHMDDFFLRPEQRTPERYATPGENVDHERFTEEVLKPLMKGGTFAYYPFDCNTMRLSEDAVTVTQSRIVIIEGSYSLRRDLREYYDLKVFLTVSPEVQMQRVIRRNPEKEEAFRTRWIPYEELYFTSCDAQECADLVIDTTELF